MLHKLLESQGRSDAGKVKTHSGTSFSGQKQETAITNYNIFNVILRENAYQCLIQNAFFWNVLQIGLISEVPNETREHSQHHSFPKSSGQVYGARLSNSTAMCLSWAIPWKLVKQALSSPKPNHHIVILENHKSPPYQSKVLRLDAT